MAYGQYPFSSTVAQGCPVMDMVEVPHSKLRVMRSLACSADFQLPPFPIQ